MKKSAKLLIVSGAICICGAIGLFAKMQIENAATSSENLAVTDDFNAYLTTLDGTEIKEVDTTQNNESVYIDGDLYLGIIIIESVGIELPVNYEWTDAKLSSSPCYYDGLLYEDTLIIGGHNSSIHFGPLHQVELGDVVEFIDPSGTVHTYTVTESYVIAETEVEELKDIGDSDLTLFTCYSDNSYRRVIRCERIS